MSDFNSSEDFSIPYVQFNLEWATKFVLLLANKIIRCNQMPFKNNERCLDILKYVKPLQIKFK